MDVDEKVEPIDREKTPVLQRKSSTVDVGSYSSSSSSWKGNEDRCYIYDSDDSDVLITYVFDGHGGSVVANILFEMAMSSNPSVNLFLELSGIFSPNLDNQGVRMLIEGVFDRLSKRFVGHDSVGSTALIGIHQKSTNKVRFVHIGDSRAVWRVHRRRSQEIISHTEDEKGGTVNSETIEIVTFTDGQTRDHKANRPDEMDRIKKLGGLVVNFNGWRVNGSLSVSRSFGDTHLHPYVSTVPEISPVIEFKSGDCYVLGSDGVWNVASSHGVLTQVTNGRGWSALEHATDIVEFCLKSGDDTTAIVVKIL